MTARPDRRGFLKRSAATAAAMGLGDLGAVAQIRAAGAAETKPSIVKLRFDPDTDRLAQLIQRTSRDRVIPVMVEQLRKGLSQRRFMAALLRTAMRYHHFRVERVSLIGNPRLAGCRAGVAILCDQVLPSSERPGPRQRRPVEAFNRQGAARLGEQPQRQRRRLGPDRDVPGRNGSGRVRIDLPTASLGEASRRRCLGRGLPDHKRVVGEIQMGRSLHERAATALDHGNERSALRFSHTQ